MRKRLAIAGLAAGIAVGAAASAPAQTGPPRLLGLRISNGGTPFAGDTPWLATVSPNGDGFRDRALLRFKLDREATVGISTDAKRVRLQLFSFASLPKPTVHDLRTGGVAVAPAVQLAWPSRGNAVHYVQISATGVAQSGLYFLRVNSADGRVGYAP